MTELSNTIVQHPTKNIGWREPHRVAIIQDWGAGVQPLYDQYDATRLALEEATASGLIDREVEVEVLEFEGLPYGQTSTFVRRIETLIEDFDPLALIGPHQTEVVTALLPYFDEWCIPTITMCGTLHAASPWLFLTPNGTFCDEAILMTDHCIEVFGSKRLGIIREENLLGDEYAEWIRRRARARRLTIVSDVAVSSFTTPEDGDAAFATLRDAGADAVTYVGFGAAAGAVFGASQRVKESGYRPDLITMSMFMGTTPGLAAHSERDYGGLLDGYEGWTGVDQFDENNPFYTAMLDRFAARYDGRRTAHCYTPQGYDMGNALAHGIALAKPLSHDGLRNGLERVRRVPATIGGPGNLISFGPNDHRGYKGDYIVMRMIQEGRNILAPKVTLTP